MSCPEQRQPAAFSQILGDQALPLIVGGQAVNIWAEIYVAQEPSLERFQPFTSRDADIYGTRDLAASLAQRAGWECHFPKERDSVCVAILSKASAGQSPLTIEVLGEVNGLTEADLGMTAIIELGPGKKYRIPSPIVLLKAKLYNLVSLANLDRPQDIKHTRMLLRIVPQYLNELAAEQRAGAVTEANLIGAIRYTASVIHSTVAASAGRIHSLNFRSVFHRSLSVGSSVISAAVAAGLAGLPAAVGVAEKEDEAEDMPPLRPEDRPEGQSRKLSP